MTNFILFCVLALIIGGAIWYIISQKKKGVKCIGCPAGGSCEQAKKNEIKCDCNKH